ncbi:MAG: glycoside hydrolase family 26 protein [Tannerellaceae bacterium]|nr:glycoside hydrolase family 26 protein [Tannerellaceae bacterium]
MKKMYWIALSLVCILTCCASSPAEAAPELPSDKNATPETVALYNHLKQLMNKGIMFGHQDDLLYGIGWKYDERRSDVHTVTGDYAAVHGYEIGHIELGHDVSLDSIHFDVIRARIIESYKRNGINTISWHGDNPLTGGTSWDPSDNQTVKSVLPGGEKHALYITWLDRLADFLLSLKDENGTFVPVIFRPYHEHMGSWFWWGKDICTVDEYKAIWKMTVEYLRDTRNIHHLLYAYSNSSVATETEYMERYPGDDYIDLIGFDTYQNEGPNGKSDFIRTVKTNLDIITKVGKERNKIPALTECGLEKVTDPQWFTGTLYEAIQSYPISYVLVWRNAYEKPDHYYAPYPGHTSSEDFLRFKQLPGILFEKDLPDMYK